MSDADQGGGQAGYRECIEVGSSELLVVQLAEDPPDDPDRGPQELVGREIGPERGAADAEVDRIPVGLGEPQMRFAAVDDLVDAQLTRAGSSSSSGFPSGSATGQPSRSHRMN